MSAKRFICRGTQREVKTTKDDQRKIRGFGTVSHKEGNSKKRKSEKKKRK